MAKLHCSRLDQKNAQIAHNLSLKDQQALAVWLEKLPINLPVEQKMQVFFSCPQGDLLLRICHDFGFIISDLNRTVSAAYKVCLTLSIGGLYVHSNDQINRQPMLYFQNTIKFNSQVNPY
ncbi:hypothetical protein D5018_14980 [Parashewanella curva]|uniref:Uncharacterized protein n=1 Tax=Parashewanella curva TaxID=2338552 RepID=A0A3L8PU13_9GAMM|nr:hypothetical protein [Parashewanella curva]RLV58905.1 hypothetical protein D5018_14980 [Parashewanella curva]